MEFFRSHGITIKLTIRGEEHGFQCPRRKIYLSWSKFYFDNTYNIKPSLGPLESGTTIWVAGSRDALMYILLQPRRCIIYLVNHRQRVGSGYA